MKSKSEKQREACGAYIDSIYHDGDEAPAWVSNQQIKAFHAGYRAGNDAKSVVDIWFYFSLATMAIMLVSWCCACTRTDTYLPVDDPESETLTLERQPTFLERIDKIRKEENRESEKSKLKGF